ncbi:hypothetical protein [Endozoicomonas sp.]|uniref:hypothetical protein n=1 Tax=Endozoicomonas sp. TaxID=1892382 RepID=UPI003AF69C4D
MTVNYYEWCSHSSCENRALLFQSFRESTLWITPMSEKSEEAFKSRVNSILERTTPVVPDVL